MGKCQPTQPIFSPFTSKDWVSNRFSGLDLRESLQAYYLVAVEPIRARKLGRSIESCVRQSVREFKRLSVEKE